MAIGADGQRKDITEMREVQGYPLPLGVQISKDRVNFSIAVPADKDCQLLLYRTGERNRAGSLI